MQVSVEAGEGLERKMTVQVPLETLEVEIDTRLQSMQGRVKIDGFRPGKVPLKVVRQRYGDQVFQEVAGEMMQSSFRDAITRENLRPAGDPSIQATGFEPGKPLEYIATFEVYPEVELKPVSELKFETRTAVAGDVDVDKMLETLRGQKAAWEEARRKSADGDRVTIDFSGSIDDVAFDGGSAKDVPVIIGSGSMIPGFEDHLTGLSAGDETKFEVPFPADYQAANLAGKTAEFAIKVNKVESSVLPELNEEFAKSFGVAEGGLEKLKEDIRANLQRELENRINLDTKNRVMDKLLEANPVVVPQSIVKEEAESLKQQMSAQQGGADMPLESLMGEATRRVQLGMILTEVVKAAELKPDPAKVQERIALMSQEYEDPAEFVNYYKGNQQLMRGIETLVMEDMAVDWVVGLASVTQVESTFDEIMNPASGK